MKKTININLGGQPFIIDEPAFDMLHHYFESLKQKFANENEQKEIIADIESRIAELFTQRLGKTRAVVGEEDVIYVTTLMGRPEDIAGEPDTAGAGTQANTTIYTTASGKVEKKLFRDPDNKKVGGVISGLCYYFGWGDPTWIRIALAGVLVMTIVFKFGIGLPIAVIYLILLIVVPEATTSAEKLQMRGEPVTIQNIEKEVRDAMNTAGHSMNTLLRDDKVRNGLSTAARAFAKIFLVFVLLFCTGSLIVLAMVCLGLSIFSAASLSDLTRLFVSSRHMITMFNVGLFLAVGIPLISVMYDSIRFLTDSNVKNPILKKVFWGGWFIGLALLAFSSWSILKDFAASDTVQDKVQLVTPAGGTLHVQMADTLGHIIAINDEDESGSSSFTWMAGMATTDFGYSFSDIKLEVVPSPDSNFYVERVAFSKGASFADASKNIKMIKYRFSQSDSLLNLDSRFELPKDGKWRDQHIKIRIYVPEGKRLSFAPSVDAMEVNVKSDDYTDDGVVSGKVLQVEHGKLMCTNCKERMISDDESDLPEPPEAPEAPGVPGEHFKVRTDKDSDELKDFTVNINDKGMEVRGKNAKNQNVHVQINEHKMSVSKTDAQGHPIK
ncbi:MAG: PspC domain-containing protein [Bacteroidetes bacterium]|nr:PspC domain-containing protein [Bacteroidota bacterium]